VTEPPKNVEVSELLTPNDLLFRSTRCSLHHSKYVGATHILYDYVLVSILLQHVKLAQLDSLLLLLTKQSKLCSQNYSKKVHLISTVVVKMQYLFNSLY